MCVVGLLYKVPLDCNLIKQGGREWGLDERAYFC